QGDDVGKGVAEEAGYAKGDVHPRPAQLRLRDELDAGHPSRLLGPHRPHAEQGQRLGHVVAAGSHGRGAPDDETHGVGWPAFLGSAGISRSQIHRRVGSSPRYDQSAACRLANSARALASAASTSWRPAAASTRRSGGTLPLGRRVMAITRSSSASPLGAAPNVWSPPRIWASLSSQRYPSTRRTSSSNSSDGGATGTPRSRWISACA